MQQPLTITLIQTNLYWEDKAANRAMLEQKILGIKNKTEVVVLPEMFSTGFSMKPQQLAETMDGETVHWMKRMAQLKKIILTGSIIIEEDGNYFNRLIWMLPNGSYGCYNKRHLFGYAGEDEHYTSGNSRLIASVKGWKINVQICYDLRFPVWARQAPLSTREQGETEYDILLYVANWPESRNGAWQTLLAARAIENQCYVIGVNRIGNDGNGISYCGNSLVTDALGNTVWNGKNEEEIYTITIEKQHLLEARNQYPFLRDADHFTIHP